MSLLDRKMIVVHGKGGVGRTTLTAAIGLAGARSGRRTCIVEISNQQALARSLGFSQPSYVPREVTPNLDLCSLSVATCLADFGRRKLRIDALARLFFESRIMTGFIEAVPGLHDVVQLGKVENMINEPHKGEHVYDLVVLDAPATGHGLTLLASARAMREMTRVGPFHDLALVIEAFLSDPASTAHVLTMLPEVLPVSEGLELAGRLRDTGSPPAAVLLNAMVPRPLPDLPASDALRERLARRENVAASTLLQLLSEADERHARQREARQALEHGLEGATPVVTLPELATRPSSIEDHAPLAEALVALEAIQ